VEAELRIVTGLVEPHFMAGYSGGRKVIAPGLAHADTITTFHNGAFMSHPATTNCNLIDNPLHEEQLEIVRMLPGTLALNTVIDEQRQLAFVNFGDVLASHEAALEFIRPYCELRVGRLFPTVLTTAAGYPLDTTYYQTVKGMVGALGILEPDGDLIIASECSEGLGSAEFADAQRRLLQSGPEAFVQSLLTKPRAAIDEWQTQMQAKAMRVARIHLYAPSLSPQAAQLTGVHCIPSIAHALHEIVTRKSNPHVAIIPEGPYVIPM
jgi:nickel-dependent lactate racemase